MRSNHPWLCYPSFLPLIGIVVKFKLIKVVHTNASTIFSSVKMYACPFVGRCLATKVFIGKLPAVEWVYVGGHRVGQ